MKIRKIKNPKALFIIILLNLISHLSYAKSEKAAKSANTPKASAAVETAKTPETAENNTGASDKVDLKKIEDKYWSAKDDEYGVIQNRTFSKAQKIYASIVYGPLINDPFAKAKATGLMFGYYINEDFGVELSSLTYGSAQNDTVTAYETQFGGTKPDFNLVKAVKALSITYTPFYAKMAFMNIGIVYFDMGFTLGLGQTDYEIQKVNKDGVGNKSQANELASATSYEISFVQQLFINKNVAFRLDIKNSYYPQITRQYEIGIGAPESSRTSTTKNANDTTISVGLTLFTN